MKHLSQFRTTLSIKGFESNEKLSLPLVKRYLYSQDKTRLTTKLCLKCIRDKLCTYTYPSHGSLKLSPYLIRTARRGAFKTVTPADVTNTRPDHAQSLNPTKVVSQQSRKVQFAHKQITISLRILGRNPLRSQISSDP